MRLQSHMFASALVVGGTLALIVSSAFTRGGGSETISSHESVQAQVGPAPDSQVSGVQVAHRFGQTFITWQEPQPAITSDVAAVTAVTAMRYELDQKRKIRYRVYRSDARIVSVANLTPIGEVAPLSVWNTERFGLYPSPAHEAPRFVIQDGAKPLPPGTGLYVHNPSAAGQSFYAVTLSEAGRENRTLSAGNSTTQAVTETVGQGRPVLQVEQKTESFLYVTGGVTLRYYVRWEAPPNFSVENQPFDYLVGIPPGATTPAPVMIGLHAWGGSLEHDYGWWFNAEKGAMLVASNLRPYDWWTGFQEHLFTPAAPKTPDAWKRGVVRPYAQRRTLSFLDWVAQNYKVDLTRTFVAGASMGGSGAVMLGLRFPERVAWVMSWVGIHRPRESPTFKASYDEVYGKPEYDVKFEDGTPVWDYFDDVWYVRQHPERDAPFLILSNGKNDVNIGWPQAAAFVKALQDTRQPHMFVWGQNSHNERAGLPGGDQRIMPLDLRVGQSLPAFTHGSLDGNPGAGPPEDGDPAGQINGYMLWETKDIVDEANEWGMTVGLFANAPEQSCTVNLTPRRTQKWKPRPGERVTWTNTSVGGPKIAQSGEATVDQWGLVTIERLMTSKGKTRVRIHRSPSP
jgi:pimeloyl-ACP methyl ester carboxylesterase